MTCWGTKSPGPQSACARLAAPDSTSMQSARINATVTDRHCGNAKDIIFPLETAYIPTSQRFLVAGYTTSSIRPFSVHKYGTDFSASTLILWLLSLFVGETIAPWRASRISHIIIFVRPDYCIHLTLIQVPELGYQGYLIPFDPKPVRSWRYTLGSDNPWRVLQGRTGASA